MSGSTVDGRRRLYLALRSLLTRHWPLFIVVAVGTIVRIVCLLAYQPALLWNGDSYTYLRTAQHLQPPEARPAGYPLLLRLVMPFDHLVLVPAVQHLLGLGLGVALYVLMLRRGAARWLAVLVATPVLLDAYQVDIEQFVMAETVFQVLLVAAFLVLLHRARPSVTACVLVGLLLAAASLTRTVALAVVLLVGVYLIVRRLGPLRLASFLVAVALPLAVYASWFHHVHGRYALEQFSGRFLWGRVEQFADCSKLTLTPQQHVLCDPTPPALRGDPNGYLYGGDSPLRRLHAPSAVADKLAGLFAKQVIRRQPGEYAKVVLGDVAHYFAPGRFVGRRDWFNGTWIFPAPNRPIYWHVNYANLGLHGEALPPRRPSPTLVGLLRGYQVVVFTPGPMLLVALLVAVGSAAWPSGTSRSLRPLQRQLTGSSRVEARRLESAGNRDRWDALLLAFAGLTMLVLPAATTSFDFRYLLPTLVLLPPAAAFGWLHLRAARWEPAEKAARSEQTAAGSGSQTDLPTHAEIDTVTATDK